MYYNDYEDYMRSVLGYNNVNDHTYGNGYSCGGCYDNMNQMNAFQSRNLLDSNVEQMYPEIYKVINPMVCRMCDSNNQPVTEYLIEQMTDDIYDNVVNRVEIQNIINLNIETREIDENTQKSSNNRSINTKASKTESNSKVQETEERETRSPQPRRRNKLLRDLIRILLLNRIFGNGRPNRPPFRPGPRPRPMSIPPMHRYDN